MTGRKFAALSSSLLARKGEARPAAAGDGPAADDAPAVDPGAGPLLPGWESAPLAPGKADRAGRGRLRWVALFAGAALIAFAAGFAVLRQGADEPKPVEISRRVSVTAQPAAPVAATVSTPLRPQPDMPADRAPPAAADLAPSSSAAAPPTGDSAMIAASPHPDPTVLAPLPLPPAEPAPAVTPAAEVAVPRPVPAPRPAVPATVAARPAPPATKPGRYAVQLAALTSESRARTESTRLAKRLGTALDGRKPVVERAKLSGNRTVYRIRVAGLASRAAAERICAKAKAAGGGCFVIRK